MVRNKFILLIPFLLFGCATTEPTIKVVTQKVEIPVATACKTVTPTAPSFSFNSLSEENTIYEKSQIALSDLELHRSYEIELLAALKSCK